jgi:acetyl esterase
VQRNLPLAGSLLESGPSHRYSLARVAMPGSRAGQDGPDQATIPQGQKAKTMQDASHLPTSAPGSQLGGPDYDELIDAPTWAFITETARFYPADAVGLTMAQQRAVYDRMCRAFHAGYPEGVTARDAFAAGVPLRVYETAGMAGTAVYMHGGGFVVGGLESHDDVCAEICAAAGLRVVSVDYRLAPEHRHPAAFKDCQAAVQALHGDHGPLVLAGDSAGAALAASVSHALRGGAVRLLGQVLIYPGLGGDRNAGSYMTHANAPMLTRDDVLFYARIRYDGPEPQDDPTAAVLQDKNFAGLPPTVVFSAECDPLCDDGSVYAGRIRNAGGQARWVCEPGLVHGYLRARHSVPRAAASFGRITTAIRALRDGVPVTP